MMAGSRNAIISHEYEGHKINFGLMHTDTDVPVSQLVTAAHTRHWSAGGPPGKSAAERFWFF